MLILINHAGLFCRLRIWVFGAPLGKLRLFFGEQLVDHGDFPRVRFGRQELLAMGEVGLKYET